jgi:hypothetical protein
MMVGAEWKPLLAAVASHRPLGPADRDAEQEERAEVGDHEGAATVLGRLAGETEEVAQSDGGAGHGEDHAEL